MLLETKSIASTEQPPPYDVPRNDHEDSKLPLDGTSNSSVNPPRHSALDPLGNVRVVRSLFTFTHHKAISGTFCIDPDLTGNGHSVEIQPYAACKFKGKCKGRFRSIPNASFFSKHGNITINLAASSSLGNGKPARVNVGTRSGNVLVTLFDVEHQSHLNLDITSRRGNVALLVPRNFSGALHLHTKRGSLTFLPSFAQHMRVLKTTDDEALVLFGTSNAPLSASFAESSTADYCELTSRFGSVTVGLAGQDHFTGHESGFWKKIGEYLMGGDLKTGVVGEAKIA